MICCSNHLRNKWWLCNFEFEILQTYLHSLLTLQTILMYMTYNLPTPPISTLVFRSREPTPTILDFSGGTNQHIPVQNFTALVILNHCLKYVSTNLEQGTYFVEIVIHFFMQADLASRWIEDNKLKVIASNWLSTETKVHAVERYDHTQRNVSASFDFKLKSVKFSRDVLFLRFLHCFSLFNRARASNFKSFYSALSKHMVDASGFLSRSRLEQVWSLHIH